MKLHFTLHASMVGRLEHCLLVSFRVPAAEAQRLTPAGLELVTLEARGERFAFVNAVFCRIDAMRPAWLPPALGVTYHHAAYRLNVRAKTQEGERSGLYFLRSDVDDGMIALGGELVSDFRFHKASISCGRTPSSFGMVVGGPDPESAAHVEADLNAAAPLSHGSVFASLDEARDFLKYQPTGLAPVDGGRAVRLAEVHREEAAWNERAVRVVRAESAYVSRQFPTAALELATWVEPLDYRWTLGRKTPLARI